MNKRVTERLNKYITCFGHEMDQSEKENFDEMKDLLMKVEKKDGTSIVVFGTMKSGKSTLINALIGADLMPNETNACTLVPTEVQLQPYRSKVRCQDVNSHANYVIQGEEVNQKFHELVQKERQFLEEKGQVQIERFFVEHPLSFQYLDKSDRIRFIDTPGINEMKLYQSEVFNIEKIVKEEIQFADFLIYVINIEYFKDEANQKLIEWVVREKGDLKQQIIFVVNKKDVFDDERGITLEQTIVEIKNNLKFWGIEDPKVISISAKEALYAHMLDGYISHASQENLKLSVHDLEDTHYFTFFDENDSYLKKNILSKNEKGEYLVKELTTVRDELYERSNIEELSNYMQEQWLNRLDEQTLNTKLFIYKKVLEELEVRVNEKVRRLELQLESIDTHYLQILNSENQVINNLSDILDERLFKELERYIKPSYILNELEQRIDQPYFLDTYLKKNRPILEYDESSDESRYSQYHRNNITEYHLDLLNIVHQLDQAYQQAYYEEFDHFIKKYEDLFFQQQGLFNKIKEVQKKHIISFSINAYEIKEMNYQQIQEVSPLVEEKLKRKLKQEGIHIKKDMTSKKYVISKNEHFFEDWEAIYVVNALNSVYEIPHQYAEDILLKLNTRNNNIGAELKEYLQEEVNSIKKKVIQEEKRLKGIREKNKEIKKKIKEYQSILK